MTFRVSIIGASGFIGRTLSRSLAAEGYSITAISRRIPPPEERLGGIEYRMIADMRDVPALAKALEGTECVLHLADRATRAAAGFANSDSPRERMEAICAAMRISGIQNLVYASTVYARLFEEGVENHYGRQKLDAERVALASDDIRPIILRLLPVYGEGGGGGFATLQALVRKGLPLPFGRFDKKRDYLWVLNLADLVRTILSLDDESWSRLSGAIFEPSDGAPVSTADLAKLIAAAMGKKIHLFAAPKELLAFVAKLAGKSEAFHAAADPLLALDSERLESALGWVPRAGMPQTLSFIAHS